MNRDPFAAIADPTRRAIIDLLKYSPKYGQLWVKGKFIYET